MMDGIYYWVPVPDGSGGRRWELLDWPLTDQPGEPPELRRRRFSRELHHPNVWPSVLDHFARAWQVALPTELAGQYTALPRGRVFDRTIKRGQIEAHNVPDAHRRVADRFEKPNPWVLVHDHWDPTAVALATVNSVLRRLGAGPVERPPKRNRFDWTLRHREPDRNVKLLIELWEVSNVVPGRYAANRPDDTRVDADGCVHQLTWLALDDLAAGARPDHTGPVEEVPEVLEVGGRLTVRGGAESLRAARQAAEPGILVWLCYGHFESPLLADWRGTPVPSIERAAQGIIGVIEPDRATAGNESSLEKGRT